MKQPKLTKKFMLETISIIRETKVLLWSLIEFDITKFKFEVVDYKYSLTSYHSEVYRNCNIELLINLLDLLKSHTKFKSNKYVDDEDIEELENDLMWLEKYILECRYISIIRWLSNIESTLRTIQYNYFKNLKEARDSN